MFQPEKLSVPVEFTEETQRSLKYVLSFATEIRAQFIVLQVLEKKAEKYSLIFPVPLLEKWPFDGRSVPTIPLSAWPREQTAGLAGVIERVAGVRRQVPLKSHWRGDGLVKILTTTFHDDRIDMVVFELGTRLPFPHRIAVDLLRAIKDLPYPVLLSNPHTQKNREAKEASAHVAA